VTAFQGNASGGQGVVFFSGTRFNPVTAGRCVSTFDTIIFGLFARTGGIAYATTEYDGVKAVGIPRPPVPPPPGGPPPVDQGTGADGAEPPPCQDGPPKSKPGSPTVVKAEKVMPGSAVCR
jgi:hypothetical protein